VTQPINNVLLDGKKSPAARGTVPSRSSPSARPRPVLTLKKALDTVRPYTLSPPRKLLHEAFTVKFQVRSTPS
jgi:hypothetical protein